MNLLHRLLFQSFKTSLLLFCLSLFIFFPVQSQVKSGEVKQNIPKTGVNQDKSIKSVSTLVSTIEISSMFNTEATCKFEVTGMTVTESGVCYSLKTGPTINDKQVISSSRIGEQSVVLKSLINSTLYYVWAYAKQGTDVVYRNELSFTSDINKESNTKPKGKKDGTVSN